jgi:hypothetical protein
MKVRQEMADSECVECQAAVAPLPSATAPDPPAGPSVLSITPDDSNWVLIQVVGEDGTPLIGEPFSLRLPNGQQVSGRLDRRGKVRAEGVGEGEVMFSLPERDHEGWDTARGGT